MADILLVDDADNVRRAISLQLSRINSYNVTEVDSGNKAIKCLKEKYFDLVITDLIMSPIDGIQVLKQSDPCLPNEQLNVSFC